MDVLRSCCCACLMLAIVAAPATLRADSADDAFSQAAAHYQARRWSEARTAFDEFAQSHASDRRAEQAAFYAAESLIQLHQHAEAAAKFAELAKTVQDETLARKVRFRAGEASYLAGDLSSARKQLDAFQAGHPRDPLDAYALTYLGEIELANSDALAAERWFKASLAAFPDGSLADDAHFGLGRAAELGKHWDAALSQYTQLIDRSGSPRRADAKLRAAVCLHHLDKLDDATEHLTGLIAQGEGGLEARYWLGMIQRQQDDWTTAAATFLTAALEGSNDPLGPTLTYHAAEALLRAGQPKQALAELERLIATWPDDALVPSALVLAITATDELHDDVASQRFAASLEKDFPDHALTAQVRQSKTAHETVQQDTSERTQIAALLESGRLSEGIERLTKFIAEHPADEQTAWATTGLTMCRIRLAEQALQSGDTATASRLLKDALDGKPAGDLLAHTLYLQAQIAVGAGDWAAAERPMRRLTKDVPDSTLVPLAEYWIAESLYQRQKFAEAGTQFERLADRLAKTRPAAPSIEAWQANVPLRRAQIATIQKQWDAAIELATPIAVTYPKFDRLHEADEVLGRAQAALADFAAARESFHRVIDAPAAAQTECAARCQWMIGETFFLQEDYPAAIREYLRVEVLHAYPTWQAAALFEAAKCHERLGDTAQATELYARLLKNYPDSPLAAEASSRLRTADKNQTPAAVPPSNIGG